jgi:hypothetical protein
MNWDECYERDANSDLEGGFMCPDVIFSKLLIYGK